MNTSKTLLAILVEELPKIGGWPEGVAAITQDSDAAINTYNSVDGLEVNAYGTWRCLDSWIDFCITAKNAPCLASDYATAIITRDQYEAALAASKEPLTGTGVDGWIDWAGGECPITPGALVDIMLQDGEEYSGMTAEGWRWEHLGNRSDIIKYRLHQPQEAENTVDHFEGAPEWAMLRVKHKADGDEYFIASMDEMKYQSIGATIGRPVKFSHQHWDVIATREPQDANSRANDDRMAQHAAAHAGFASTIRDEETDLNDCIGQAPHQIWDGEGNPHIGAAVEWNEGRRWFPGTVTAITDEWIIIKDRRGNEGAYLLDVVKLRPENFERDQMAAILEESLDKHAGFVDAITMAAADLIKAGYRKQ